MHLAKQTLLLTISLLLPLAAALAQQPSSPLAPFIAEDAPVLVLQHVRLIDGTGSAPREDLRIDIAAGKIVADPPLQRANSSPRQRQSPRLHRQDHHPRHRRHA